MSLRSFTFVPMLTPDDGSGQGSRRDHTKARAGYRNTSLVRHLTGRVREGKRDIKEIRPFFEERGVPIHIHGAGFSHKKRAGYFRSLPDPWLRDALVLLDPDIGMEVARPTEKHHLFSEIADLSGRMGTTSVLMIFQYFPRARRGAYTKKRVQELEEISSQESTSVSDNQVAFFFLGREAGIMAEVRGILASYQEDYPGLTLSGGRDSPRFGAGQAIAPERENE